MNSVIDTVKERIDIVDFIGEYVQLRKAGRNYVGFCPFHQNTRTPAFTVFSETQSYHCFGCKASGTVFDFVMQREGLEFRETLEMLAHRVGVELKPRTEADEQRHQLHERLLEINAAAAKFFQHTLLKSPHSVAARAYVEQRGFDAATIEAFQLGYSREDWSALLAYLTNHKGFEPEEVEAAGLAIKRDGSGYYDRFRGRLMFPIRNVKGQVIAFGGRALGDANPKYLNSPQTPLFDKSHILYGLDLARSTIRNQETAVIVEGYIDVIVAYQYGFRNVVAPLGTALTSEHAAVLKKLTKRIYLALDADAAGINATLKGIETLRHQSEGDVITVPTPQGVMQWGADTTTEIRVIAMPDGQDPDNVIQADPEQWRALVENAQPIMDFYIAALTSDLDLRSARGKADAVARLAPLLVQVSNPIEQAHYIQRVARLVEVEDHVIRAALPGSQRPTPTRTKAIKQPEGDTPTTREDALLALLLRYPSMRTAVQEKMKSDISLFPLVSEMITGILLELFDRADNRAIWQTWMEQAPDTDIEHWITTLDAVLAEQVRHIMHIHLPDSQSYRYMNDGLECATILQLRLARRWKDRCSQEEVEAHNDEERYALLERIIQLKQYIDTISIPKRSSTYADLHALRTA
ncbi:MAG: DNA primase [Chloroflexota bacterium]